MLRPIPGAHALHALHASVFRSLVNALGEAWDPPHRGSVPLYSYAVAVVDAVAQRVEWERREGR
jgi:hypothetical protein